MCDDRMCCYVVLRGCDGKVPTCCVLADSILDCCKLLNGIVSLVIEGFGKALLYSSAAAVAFAATPDVSSPDREVERSRECSPSMA